MLLHLIFFSKNDGIWTGVHFSFRGRQTQQTECLADKKSEKFSTIFMVPSWLYFQVYMDNCKMSVAIIIYGLRCDTMLMLTP
jgi:hypothetical protein